MRLSVIIPVYNAAPYLRECLESVACAAANVEKLRGCKVEKSGEGVEVICVDDGSTDGSGAILDEYASRFNFSTFQPFNFKVIHQPNRGVSAARNAALEMVTGEYVTFLDADDLFEPEFFVRALADFAADPELDLWVGQVVATDERNVVREVQPKRPPAGETTNVLVDFLRYPGRQYLFSICPKVYRWGRVRRLGVTFCEDMTNDEDALYVTKVYSGLRKAKISEWVVYRRRLHGGSLVGRPWALQVPDSLGAIRDLLEFAPQSLRPEAVRRAAAQRALSRFRLVFADGQRYGDLRDYIRALCGHPLFRPSVCWTIVRHAPGLYRPAGLLFGLFPKRFAAVLLCLLVKVKRFALLVRRSEISWIAIC